MKRKFIYFICGITFYTTFSIYSAENIIISEFMAINNTVIQDEDGNFSDWIEIANIGAVSQNLSGWYLTDDADELDKWQFPDIDIEAGKYIIVFASGEDRDNPNSALHTNFKLGGSGEYLALVQNDGTTINTSFDPAFPKQNDDISYGFYEGSYIFLITPTPGEANIHSTEDFLEPPEFSVSRGYYSNPFDLVLSVSNPNATIRYTLDGSEPSENHGEIYQSPVEISETTRIRAIAFRSGYTSSTVATHSYLFIEDIKYQPADIDGFPWQWGTWYKGDYEMDASIIDDAQYHNSIDEAFTSIPTLSLNMSIDDWFGVKTGIYSNPENCGDEWERAVSAEFIYPDNTTKNHQANCGVQIQGGTSPKFWNTSKLSLRLLFKKIYGDGVLNHKLFPDSEIESINTLILDARYNNSWHYGIESERNAAQYVRDQFINDLQNNMGWLSPHGVYMHLYINGLYWGIYCIHERPDEAFLAKYHGGDRDDYNVVRHSYVEILNGSNKRWMDLEKLLQTYPFDDQVYEQIKEYLDIPAFIDYMILNLWAGNTDWDSHNWYSSYNTNTDMKIRFFSWDAECVCGDVNEDVMKVYCQPYKPKDMHKTLIKIPEYKSLFSYHVKKHFLNNGCLTHENVIPIYMARIHEIDPAIILESARWGDFREKDSGVTYTRDNHWIPELNRLINDYFPQRTQIILEQLKAKDWYINPSDNEENNGIIISEFMAVNDSILQDADGDYSDWIEICNSDIIALNMNSYYITDNSDNLTKWRFPDIILQPGEFLIVFASGKDRNDPSNQLHTNFKLAGDGEYLALTKNNGVTILSSFDPFFPQQYENISYGYFEDNYTYLMNPTPGNENVHFIDDFLEEPKFSYSRGFFTDSFTLELTTSDITAKIKYTTDGSEPTEMNGLDYLTSINISETTTIRAICYKEGFTSSAIMTHTYIFPNDVKSQPTNPDGFPNWWGHHNRIRGDYELDNDVINAPEYSDSIDDALTSIPTLSLNMSIDDWFDPQFGIYANAVETGENWERGVSAEFIYSNDTTKNYQVNCGIQIQGASSTKNWNSPKLSMRLVFKEKYGDTTLEKKLFEDSEVVSINTLILDARNDYAWHSWEEPRPHAQYVRDQFMNDMQNTMGWISPHGIYMHIYINGLYWGIYCIHERPDDAFLSEHLGGEREDYNVVRHDYVNVMSGTNDHWMEIVDIVKGEGVNDQTYQRIKELVDIPAFIDYLLLNIWAGNDNWDSQNWYSGSSNKNNLKIRFFSWDAECVCGDLEEDVLNTYYKPYNPKYLHNQFINNSEYKTKFNNHIKKHFYNDGILTEDKAVPIYMKRINEIDPAIILESARWGDYRESESGVTYTRNDNWLPETNRLLNEYFPYRTQIVLNQLIARNWFIEPGDIEETEGLILTEFMSINDSTLQDEDGAYSDWIEIYNSDIIALNLNGYFLTDDPDNLSKWQFPDLVLQPEEYLIVFASGKDRKDPTSTIHTNFKLSGDGEYLALVKNDGTTIATSFDPAYPKQYSGQSYGYLENTWSYMAQPTPGAENVHSSGDFLPAPLFSHERGFYNDPFQLELSATNPSVTIKYTTDGSEPSSGNGITYEGVVQISGTTTVKALAFMTDFSSSTVVTHTFLFTEDVSSQPANPDGFPNLWGNTPQIPADYEMDSEIIEDEGYAPLISSALTSLPALSLTMDTEEWFDSETGIYSNPAESGDTWERAVSAEFLYPEKSDNDFQINCGVQMQGVSNNNPWKSPKHSMRLTFKKEYGETKLNKKLFEDSDIESINTMVLDGMSNMTWPIEDNEYERTHAQYLRGQFVSDLQNSMGWNAPHGFYVNLYINGLYWGIYCVHERPDDDFAAAYLGEKSGDYDVIRHDYENVISGNNTAWIAMFQLARSGLNENETYTEIQDYLNIPAFIDYMILNYWAGNTDWDDDNWYAARNQSNGSGFQFFTWNAEEVCKETNDNITSTLNQNSPTELHSLLMTNQTYQQSFETRAKSLFNGEGVLSPGKVSILYTQRSQEIDPAIVLESARWGDYRQAESGVTYTRNDHWLLEKTRLLNNYFPNRTETVMNQFITKSWIESDIPIDTTKDIIISEFMAVNDSTLEDEDGEYSDWIELMNLDSVAHNLAGWYLTDEPDNLPKWQLPNVTIDPYEYLLIFASGKDRNDPAETLHTDFKLSGSGEYLALVKENGVTVASSFDPAFPAQSADISFGIYENEYIYMSTPTPNAENVHTAEDKLPNPTFSHARGFYTSPFYLSLNIPIDTPDIIYTTDGSVPLAANGTVYQDSIQISETTTVRTFTYQEGFKSSQILTHTYLFPEDLHTQTELPDGYPQIWGSNSQVRADYGMDTEILNDPDYSNQITEALSSLPVISLNMDRDDWFDPETGIYANPENVWERDISAEFISTQNTQIAFQTESNIQIYQGTDTLHLDSPKLSMQLTLNPGLTEKTALAAYFPGLLIDTTVTIILDAGYEMTWLFPSDSTQRARAQYVRESFLDDIYSRVMETGMPLNHYVHVYLNDMYWGLYNIRQSPEEYLPAVYGLNGESVDIIHPEYDEPLSGNKSTWNTLFEKAREGIQNSEDYNEIQTLLDIPNFIQLIILNCWAGNANWDRTGWIAVCNNSAESGFNFYPVFSENILNETDLDVTGNNSPDGPAELHQYLTGYDEYRQTFEEHVQMVMENEGILTEENLTDLYEEHIQTIDPAIVLESARWGDYSKQESGDTYTRNNHWQAETNRLTNDYFSERSQIVYDQFVKAGWLKETSVLSNRNNQPFEFKLFHNAPNPFNPVTNIRYQLADDCEIIITVYDIQGRKVSELFRGEKRKGNHSISFDGAQLASGIYFFRIETVNAKHPFTDMIKMILIK